MAAKRAVLGTCRKRESEKEKEQYIVFIEIKREMKKQIIIASFQLLFLKNILIAESFRCNDFLLLCTM